MGRRIADAKPDDLGAIAPVRSPQGEIPVLSDDDAALRPGQTPDVVVERFEREQGGDMVCVEPLRLQPVGERWRQLGVDDELHAAMTAVSPIDAAA